MNRLACCACLFSLALLTGCTGSEEVSDRPKTHPVTGTVLLDGAPVEGAQVAFNPEGVDAEGAFGRTDAEGRYELTTFDSGDGAVAGNYVVTIMKFDAPPSTEAASEEEYVPPEVSGARPSAPKNLLPAQYSDRAKSGLTATVAAEGENTFDFNLTK